MVKRNADGKEQRINAHEPRGDRSALCSGCTDAVASVNRGSKSSSVPLVLKGAQP